jgi:type I restriction enzyme M protein
MAKAPKASKQTAQPTAATKRPPKEKSLEAWMWGAASSIRGQKDAAKFKDFILPLVFTKRLCDVHDDELDRISAAVGSRAKAFRVVAADKALVRFYLPLQPDDQDQPVWSVIRTLSDHIGERLTSILREIADANPLLKGILDRVDFNATTHGVRDLDDDRLSNLIEAISSKQLGLDDVEPDIIGRSYEYLIRKFAEGSGRSAGEFYTPYEVGMVMARIMEPAPGMTVYDPCCGSAGLLIKCQLVARAGGKSPGESGITLYGQENEAGTWAMANMNMIIHDMEGDIQIGDTFRRPKFKVGNGLRTFDRVVANPMWNQDGFKEADYDADELGRFTKPGGYPGGNADWGWLQHILASLGPTGRAAVVMDAGAASRGSGNANRDREKEIRRWFLDMDVIESILLLPENLFYNTPAAGIVIFLNRAKPEARQGRILVVNASAEFAKAKPKNYLPADAMDRIVETISEWREIEGFSRIVGGDEIDDCNISPSRYVQSAAGLEYRPLGEVLAELELTEKQAGAATAALHDVLSRLEEKQAQ